MNSSKIHERYIALLIRLKFYICINEVIAISQFICEKINLKTSETLDLEKMKQSNCSSRNNCQKSEDFVLLNEVVSHVFLQDENASRSIASDV